MERSRPHPSRRELVGRDGEIERLRAAWRRRRSDRGRAGPAGVGKSRLVRELSRWAAGEGGVVLVGRATARGAPLRPIREALLGRPGWACAPVGTLTPFVPTLSALVPDWGEPTVATHGVRAGRLGGGRAPPAGSAGRRAHGDAGRSTTCSGPTRRPGGRRVPRRQRGGPAGPARRHSCVTARPARGASWRSRW